MLVPAPPMKSSAPGPPIKMSSPAVPVIVSRPLVPRTVLKRFNPTTTGSWSDERYGETVYGSAGHTVPQVVAGNLNSVL